MIYELDELVKHISKIRYQKNISARKLSLRIGKSAGYISTLEINPFDMPVSVLLEIIEALDMTTEEFFYRDSVSYAKDMELLDYINNLNPKQKEAILNLYK